MDISKISKALATLGGVITAFGIGLADETTRDFVIAFGVILTSASAYLTVHYTKKVEIEVKNNNEKTK